MAFRDKNEILFCKGVLSSFIDQRLRKIDDEVCNISEQKLLTSSDKEIFEELDQKLRISPIVLEEDAATIEQMETKIDVSQMPSRNPFNAPGPIILAGIRVQINIPFQGDVELWSLLPNSWTSPFPGGNIISREEIKGTLHIVYVFPSDESIEEIKKVYEDNINNIRHYLDNQRAQIESSFRDLPLKINISLNKRRDRLKKFDNLANALGLALKPNHEGLVNPVQNSNSSDNNGKDKLRIVGKSHEWDMFISHASEDKDEFVRPLAKALEDNGIRVWFDEYTLKVGDSLRQSIDRGLARSKYGIVVISNNFLSKEWPQKELDGLFAKEVDGQKVILPIWHNINADQVREYSPMLADKIAVSSSKGISVIVGELLKAME